MKELSVVLELDVVLVEGLTVAYGNHFERGMHVLAHPFPYLRRHGRDHPVVADHQRRVPVFGDPCLGPIGVEDKIDAIVGIDQRTSFRRFG